MNDKTEGSEPSYENVVKMVRSAEKVEPSDIADPAAPRAPAESRKAPKRPRDEDPDDAGDGGDEGGGNPPPLPEGCPITPLGSNGDMYFFLDHRKAFRVFPYDKLLRAATNTLLGPHVVPFAWAWNNFPTRNKEGEQTGWSEKNCGRALMVAASLLDVWDGLDRVRGAGCWKGEEGELVVHLGNRLMVNGKSREPGLIGRHVYPADKTQPSPWHEPVEAGAEGPGDKALEILSSWNWERPDLDARLLLGWCGAAMLGGALDWRPSACVTGDMGTGKSTLEDAIRNMVGGMVHASDATAASLWTALGYSSLPISLDEFENDADDRKSQQIINLMRLSASGGIILRGSADHKLAQFQARSAFLFSGINPPPLKPQDLSRIAMLELRPLPPDVERPDLSGARMRELGAKLRRRMYDAWPRWPRVLGAYRAALLERGHSQRGADQFGTLMAAAEILLHEAEDFNAERVKALCDALSADKLAETANADRQHEECLAFIVSAVDGQWSGGKQRTVARHIKSVLHDIDASDAKEALGLLGLRVMTYEGNRYLAVANAKHQGTHRLFGNSRWKNGGHERLMRRLPGAIVPKGSALSIGGVQSRCTLVPIGLCIDADAMDREARDV